MEWTHVRWETLIRWRTTSNIETPEQSRSLQKKNEIEHWALLQEDAASQYLVSRSASRAIAACFAVPTLSILGTSCSGAYLVSNRFCLTSGFSASLKTGRWRTFWKGAACRRSWIWRFLIKRQFLSSRSGLKAARGIFWRCFFLLNTTINYCNTKLLLKLISYNPGLPLPDSMPVLS